jgi:hypothetical protein
MRKRGKHMTQAEQAVSEDRAGQAVSAAVERAEHGRMLKEKFVSKNATTDTTTYNDGKFVRTALIVEKDENGKGGSVDLVTKDGTRVGEINIFYSEGRLMVDVIDVDNLYDVRRALGFKNGGRECIETGQVVAAHFEDSKRVKD